MSPPNPFNMSDAQRIQLERQRFYGTHVDDIGEPPPPYSPGPHRVQPYRHLGARLREAVVEKILPLTGMPPLPTLLRMRQRDTTSR